MEGNICPRGSWFLGGVPRVPAILSDIRNVKQNFLAWEEESYNPLSPFRATPALILRGIHYLPVRRMVALRYKVRCELPS